MNNELYENLRKLESEELLYKVGNAMLTEEANTLALKILEERGEKTEKIKVEEKNKTNKAYGLETDNEKKSSRNTFINLLLCQFLPIFPTGILLLGIEFSKGMNLFLQIVIGVVSIGATLLIIKLAYIMLFEADDKLNTGVKVLAFAPTLIATAFFTYSLVINLFK